MTQWGRMTSWYAPKDTVTRIDRVLSCFPGKFKSRNHFINCAVQVFLRKTEEESTKWWRLIEMVSPSEVKKKIALDIVALVDRDMKADVDVVASAFALETGYRSETIRDIIGDLLKSCRLVVDAEGKWLRLPKTGGN